jgi:N-acetyl-alpha-D-glucosaminyl L-malate synthase BshA
MATVARAEQLDVFHVHYAVPHATAAFLAGQMLQRTCASTPAVVTTLHGTDTTLLGQDPSYREAIEHALSESDAITTVSRSLCAETLRTFHLQRDVEVIPNFFIPSRPTRTRAEVRRELRIGDDEFLVVHTSNVRPLKRIDLLLETFAAMRNTRARRLLILAGGSFQPHEAIVERLGIADRVIVNEDVIHVEDYLAAADAGLYTSESESFGLSILETLFHARPVVAFGVGGVPEVVRDGESGFLRTFGDVAGLAASLDRLAEDTAAAEQMGAAGRRTAEAEFSAERVVPQYELLYRRLVGRG